MVISLGSLSLGYGCDCIESSQSPGFIGHCQVSFSFQCCFCIQPRMKTVIVVVELLGEKQVGKGVEGLEH